MDLTFKISMQYCSLQHHLSSITSHIHSWMLLLLWFHFFILSGVISSLISSNILDTYRPGEFIFSVLLVCYTELEVFKATILKSFAIPFSSGPHFSEPSNMNHLTWVALHGIADSFTELDKAVFHVIRLVSFL